LQAQNVKGKEKGVWMHRHKSLGLLAGILVAPRFLFRLSSKIPAPMKEWNGFEQIASKITHLSLYGLMIGMPVSGIAMG
jgi:cytochrome b561